MLLTVNAHADSKWSGVVDDDWNNAGNWSSVAGANGWIVESTDSAFSQWPVIGNSVVNLSGTALRIASTTGGSAYLGELTIDSGTLISQTVMVMSNGNTNLSTLTVKNGGLINVTGGRIIISNGASATLNITENSKVVVEMSGTTIIGSSGASSNGTINLGDIGYLSMGTILSVGGFGGSTGAGKIVLTNSGSMQANGDFRLGGQGKGTLSVGNALALNFGALELTGNAALEMGAGSFLTFADSSAETWSGALTLSYEDAQLISFTTNRGLLQSQWELINITGYEVIGLSNSGLLQLQAVPEPSAWLLLVSGAALLLTLRRRA